MKKSSIKGRFIDNGDNTVTDSKTNLVWMKEDDGKERTWKEAMAFCEENKANLPGKGWRLPTVEELFTLIDFSRHHPAINPIFTNAKSAWYWSSTPYSGDPGCAWYVNFSGGGVGWGGIDNGNFVRPVRQNS